MAVHGRWPLTTGVPKAGTTVLAYNYARLRDVEFHEACLTYFLLVAMYNLTSHLVAICIDHWVFSAGFPST